MFICPNCNSVLVRKRLTTGVYWACDQCGGRAVGIGLLRKTIGEKLVTEAWSRAITTPVLCKRSCPICSRNMLEVTLTVEDKPLALDLCQRCEFMWFDPAQYESIPPPPPKPRALGDIDDNDLPQKARELLALEKVREIARQADAQDPELDEAWKAFPAVLGLPVEMESSPMNSIPWATYLLSTLIAAISIWAFSNLKLAIDRYGLIPDQAGRYHGLTFLTSFFLHGSVLHLAGNLYFLLIFGRPVEDFLGRWRWLLLVFLSALLGNCLHIMVDPRTTIPCIGASGGISGLIAFYALKFPHARLGFYFVYFRWIQFPAWAAFLFWVLLQVWGAYQQVNGYSNISSLAHLGGLAVGVFFWLAWRNIDLKPAPNLIQVKVV